MSWDVPECLTDYRGANDRVLREGTVDMLEGSDTLLPCVISVTQRSFIFAVNGVHELLLPWQYVIGCHCLRGRHGDSRSAYFCLYAYPPTKKRKLGVIRHRQVITFAVNSGDSFAENMNNAKAWQTLILDCIRQSVPESRRIPGPDRPYIVFLNRKSGAGRAFTIFEKSINPLFGEADMPYELILTERANHAREMMRSIDVHRYRGVVVVSGDGLVYEVLNGLFERDDWRDVVSSIPLGVVGAGSGNGLAASLCYVSGLSMLENMQLHNGLILAKPMVQPMDVIRVENAHATRVSFLSITWAMIADIDIQSERLRSLGGARFTVAAFAKILGARPYHGSLSFLPAGEYRPEERLPAQRRRSVVAVNSCSFGAGSRRVHHSETAVSLRPRPDDQPPADDVFGTGDGDAAPSRGRLQRSITLPTGSGDANGDFATAAEESAAANGHPGEAGDNAAEALDLDDVDRRPRPLPIFSGAANGHSTPSPTPRTEGERRFLPPIEQPVPDDWVTITDDFLIFAAIYQTHIATDAFVIPTAEPTDGLIHLMLVRSGAGRSVLFSILTSLENGDHVNSPYLEMIPVRAFRLEPHTPNGIISVDGERVEYGPIQAEVHSHRINVIATSAQTEAPQNGLAADPGEGHAGGAAESVRE